MMTAAAAAYVYNKYYSNADEAAAHIQSRWRGRAARKKMMVNGHKVNSSRKHQGKGTLAAAVAEAADDDCEKHVSC